MSHYTLLTGATGLVGCFLMRDLLTRNKRLAVLVRSTDRLPFSERVDSMLARWEALLEHPLARPVYLEGDINLPHLGLDPTNRRWIARHCQRVIHNAAVLKFVGEDRRNDPWRTNVGGTRRALQLCQEVGLREFHYVSTAYVCGKREGTIFEDELEAGQDFRNDYEQSKYLAEKLLCDSEVIDPPTIYRPVVIAGDSRTGFTTSYHGVYVYMRLLDILLRNAVPDSQSRRPTPLRIPLDGDERRNLVPVDWVSRVICELLEMPSAYGRAFHLAPRVPITARGFFESACSFFNYNGVEFRGADWQPGPDQSTFEQAFSSQRAVYREYERTDPVFDARNLQRFAGHLPCPEIDETVLHRYFKFSQQDGWGKRRTRLPVISIRGEDTLQRLLATLSHLEWCRLLQQFGVTRVVCGADILGPGGGQWQIAIDERGPAMSPGLPSSGQPIFRSTVERLAQLVGSVEGGRASSPRQVSSVDSSSWGHCRCERLIRLLFARLARGQRRSEHRQFGFGKFAA